MKPLKLTMTAFGPYKDTEVVDFKELDENKLFVISGNTGAGKTTIFDGICFALYGSASGTDREDNKMLRSDFASDHTHTSVELEFELHSRTYRILRQLGHVKQGNKSKTGEKYEFFENVDGKEIPCVDRQMVSEINKKVEAIIGLTQDQFKQIVMLPQGEFRKLLTSETENKEAILRRLFKTDGYKQLNELLKNKKDLVQQEFKQAEQARNQQIQNIVATLPPREESNLFQVLSEDHYNYHQVVDGLEEESQFYEKKIEMDNKQYEEAYKAHDKKQKEYHKAESINDQFSKLAHKEEQLTQLTKQIPEIKKKEKQLEDAERASQIEVYENQLKEWKKTEKEKRTLHQNADQSKQKAEGALHQAKEIYKQEEERTELRETTGKKLDELKEFLPIVREMDERKKELKEIEEKGITTRNDLHKITDSLKQKQSVSEERSLKISEMEKKVKVYPEKYDKMYKIGDQVKLLEKHLQLTKESKEINGAVIKSKTNYVDIKAQYNQLEKKWLSNQASILATHLHDGEACPVCGSVEHPNKASSHDSFITREELDQFKKRLDEKDQIYRDALMKQNSNMEQLKEVEQDLAKSGLGFENVQEQYDELMSLGKKLKQEVIELKQLQQTVDEEKKLLETDRLESKALEQKKEELEKQYNELKVSYQTAKAVYDERIRKIPEKVQNRTTLNHVIKETEERKLQLEKAWNDAQEKLQQAKDMLTKADSTLHHTKNQVEETVTKREDAEKVYTAKLKEAGFESENDYQQALVNVEVRESWKKEIQQFKENLSSLKQQVKDLHQTLEGQEKVDTEALKAVVQQYKDAYEQALSTLNRSKEYLKETKNIKEALIDTSQQVADLEKKLAAITDLYDVARGQNRHKISFERYLQIEYLEQIIDAANQRLKHLSNGQYYLIRSNRQESHGKQSGLALDVHDAYTGQTRDVKTLSGGEKFNASLCLALGMSDVIQSFQGNISINTMFIDEGFGSLDEEALHKSIDTLIDLQKSGRTIGVISHVQELKSMFPAILQVTKTKEGHSQTQFVVK